MKLQIIYNNWSNELNKQLDDFLTAWFDNTDIIQQHTSGSTGIPKEIALQKKHMSASAQLTGKYFQLQANQTALICLSPEFIAGKMMIVRALELNLGVILTSPANPFDFPDNLTIDFCAMVPLQVENALVSNPTKLVQIRSLIIGGAQIHPSLEDKLNTINVNAFATFGMTETTSHIAIRKIAQFPQPYQALDNINFSLGNEAQLIIHAPELGIDSLVTNDRVDLLTNQTFFWKGRLDFVINSGGIKFHPEVIEYKLARLIPERRFFIAGKTDDRLGNKIVLYIEGKQPIAKSDFSTVLEKYEIPKEIIYISQFSETTNGKINRLLTIKQSD